MTYEKADNIKEFLNSRVDKGQLFRASKPKQAHYAAAQGGCIRKAVYEFIGGPQLAIDMSTRLTFWFGDKGQEFVEEEFKLAHIFDTREQSIQFHDKRLTFPFSMRMDILATLPKELDPAGLMRPYEIKTMGSSQFYDQTYQGWGGRPDTTYPGAISVPKDYHLSQLNLYLKAMNLDYGYLIVICKDDSNFVIHKVTYDDKMYEDTVAHCAAVEKGFEQYKIDGTLPDRIIPDLPLGVYKRDTEKNKIGDVKLEKSSFPCIWRNKESGRWGTCNFFSTCHADTLKNLGLTMESFK